VQTATIGWNAVADQLDANATNLLQLRDQLATAEAKQRTLRRKWSDATRQILSAIAVYCDGSTDMVHGFGFGVLTHRLLGSLLAPTNLTTSSGPNPGQATVKWARGTAHHGFLVQHATDVANATTYSVGIPCTKSKFTLGGVPSSSVVHFRVAAIDPSAATGVSPWSDWIAATAR
jgi:hypothetical protein